MNSRTNSGQNLDAVNVHHPSRCLFRYKISLVFILFLIINILAFRLEEQMRPYM